MHTYPSFQNVSLGKNVTFVCSSTLSVWWVSCDDLSGFPNTRHSLHNLITIAYSDNFKFLFLKDITLENYGRYCCISQRKDTWYYDVSTLYQAYSVSMIIAVYINFCIIVVAVFQPLLIKVIMWLTVLSQHNLQPYHTNLSLNYFDNMVVGLLYNKITSSFVSFVTVLFL